MNVNVGHAGIYNERITTVGIVAAERTDDLRFHCHLHYWRPRDTVYRFQEIVLIDIDALRDSGLHCYKGCRTFDGEFEIPAELCQ